MDDRRRLANALRRFWWRRLRRHRYEICQACGRPVIKACPSWWYADDALWQEVVRSQEGIRCIPCFTDEAWAAGVSISWRPVREARRMESGTWLSMDELYPEDQRA